MYGDGYIGFEEYGVLHNDGRFEHLGTQVRAEEYLRNAPKSAIFCDGVTAVLHHANSSKDVRALIRFNTIKPGSHEVPVQVTQKRHTLAGIDRWKKLGGNR